MSERTERLTVEFTRPDARLDLLLREKFPAVSRGQLQRLILMGDVLVNGRQVKPNHHPIAGEQIVLVWPEAAPLEMLAEDIPLRIVYEDEDMLVLDKPAGLVVHPAAGNECHTLVNALLHHCAGQLSGIAGVARPGIVHRLDKDTTGLMMAAKNDTAHVGLTAQFSARQILKIYNAIVCGEVPRASGDIRAPIARHVNHRQRMAVPEEDSRGREAWTSYRVMERLTGATLVEARLHTGRTHQIRVHFQHLGFPLLGDEVYGKRPTARLAELTGFTAARQMLHARQLEFTHPRTGALMSFEAPWPADFQEAVRALRPGRPQGGE